jgi:hypothetical protein
VDLEFKKWLFNLLGETYYRELDKRSVQFKFGSHDMEDGTMRKLMARFEQLKRAFRKNTPDMKLDLPEPLDTLSIPGRVRRGELVIKK